MRLDLRARLVSVGRRTVPKVIRSLSTAFGTFTVNFSIVISTDILQMALDSNEL